jgi:23S rRNA pseudouridine2605 synthase
VRLNAFLARSGIGSRRACDRYIEAGDVEINGERVTTLGTKVQEHDEVRFRGTVVAPVGNAVYLAVNKPPLVLCSNKDPEGRPLVLDLVKHEFQTRLFTVGRLDFLSCGLVFVTNDGSFAQAVMHPSRQIEKEYLVETKDPIPEDLLERYKSGLYLEGERYKAASYQYRSARKASITLTEGKNREIRRVMMFGKIKIKRLRRIRIGPVQLRGLPQGGFRHLTNAEVKHFLQSGRERR